MRIFKTRAFAAAACRSGKVSVAGVEAKPARALRVGDEVKVRKPLLELSLRVVGLIESRVGAKEVPQHMEDLTPEEDRSAAAEVAAERRRNRMLLGERAEGRPSKRQRRQMETFLDQVERGSDSS